MTSSVSSPAVRVKDALRWAGEQLLGTTEAALAAKILLAHVLRCTLSDLFIRPERTLTTSEQETYRALIARRASHEPVAYLVGHRAFLDLDLAVDVRVLIPRPETELLVEQAIAVARRWSKPRIVDVGTGSGAIAVGLAVHVPCARVFAIDSAAGAIQVARQNAGRYGVSGRITFLEGDLLLPLPVTVDLIVANLPYVSEAEYAMLSPDIRLYEPRAALVAGADGLSAIRDLLDTAGAHLADDGVILIEIGAGQGSAILELASRALPGARIEVIKDYARHDRIVRIDRQFSTLST
jgi:release factor glutamine methyltransferase